ncbi:hypothetical protein GQ53DRAFT_813391 [Thozetella sp. PMI_491]|nr:hypothetical protein GQ53DRAFT_813391 [Thozetella sp. PMI_491]
MPFRAKWLPAAIILADLVVQGQAAPYACLQGFSLCPVVSGVAMQRCGEACYRPEIYTCIEGGLIFSPQMVPQLPLNPTISPVSSATSSEEAAVPSDESLLATGLTPTSPDGFTDDTAIETAPSSASVMSIVSTDSVAPEEPTASSVIDDFDNESVYLATLFISDPTPSDGPYSYSEDLSQWEASVPPFSDMPDDPPVTLFAGDTLSSFESGATILASDFARITVEIYPFDGYTTTLWDGGISSTGPDSWASDTPVPDPSDFTVTAGAETTMSVDGVSPTTDLELPAAPSSTVDEMVPSNGDMMLSDESRLPFQENLDLDGLNSTAGFISARYVAAARVLTWGVANGELVAVSRPKDATLGIDAITVLPTLRMLSWHHSLRPGAQPTFQPGGIFEAALAEWFMRAWNQTDYWLSIFLSRYLSERPDAVSVLEQLLPTSVPEDVSFENRIAMQSDMILNSCASFVEGGQVKDNLLHLSNLTLADTKVFSLLGTSEDEIPNFVNTAVVPAALRSVSFLAAAGHIPPEYGERANKYAQIWEDNTLQFFEVTVTESVVSLLVDAYVPQNHTMYQFPHDNHTISFYGPSIEPDWNPHAVTPIMTLQDCFRLCLLNTTDDVQLYRLLDQAANLMLAPYPFGLKLDQGFAMANRAFLETQVNMMPMILPTALDGRSDQYWLLPAMATRFGRQLDRCAGPSAPGFCSDGELRTKLIAAYDAIWSALESVDPIHGPQMLEGEQPVTARVEVHPLGLKKLQFE